MTKTAVFEYSFVSKFTGTKSFKSLVDFRYVHQNDVVFICTVLLIISKFTIHSPNIYIITRIRVETMNNPNF